MPAMQAKCELKKGLFRCGATAVGLCQYCGRPFCERHGVFLDEAQEVCNQTNCVAKREDIARHLVYKDSVAARNAERHCGIAGCERGLSGQCVRCNGYFCSQHVGRREEPVLEGQVRVMRQAMLCKHCLDRRPIWTRT